MKKIILSLIGIVGFLMVFYFIIKDDLKDIDQLGNPIRQVLFDKDSLLVYKEIWGVSSNHTIVGVEGACCKGKLKLFPPVVVEITADSAVVKIYSIKASKVILSTEQLQVINVTRQEMLELSQTNSNLLYKILD